jgi:DNA replication protein DnaC
MSKRFEQTEEEIAAIEARNAKYAEEMKRDEYERRLRRANIPLRHAGFDIKTVPDSPWLQKFKEVCTKGGSGTLIAFVGPRGTGKTQFAVEVIKRCCFNRHEAFYCKVLEIFFDVRATYRSNNAGAGEMQALAKYMDPNLLVIDEAHERGESAFEDRILTYVVDKRYDAEKDTFLISNLTKEEFLTAIGPSIASRLQETGGIIVCDWASYR